MPLKKPVRYKGAKGGRASGKSHFFAEEAVEAMVVDPALRFVCIREVQRSLKFSAKSLIEAKIREMGVEHMFSVLTTEIRRRGGTGIMIFEGMQDHTADSIKSLENFGRAWVEEAQRLSARSLQLLTPTIRAPGSQVWFSWNPDQPDDPVDKYFRDNGAEEDFACVHVNYMDNPFCPQESLDEANRMKRVDPESYPHVWLGEYNVRSNAQVLAGKWRVDEFEPENHWDGPYYGLDFGFSQDPTAATRSWIGDGRLWIEHEAGGVGMVIDDTERMMRAMPGGAKHRWRADSASPDRIEELSRRGLDIQGAVKGQGSVEAGVEFLRNFEEIVIHERCVQTQQEARLWSYKTDRLTGDPLPKLADGNDHYMDATRYALSPLIRPGRKVMWA